MRIWSLHPKYLDTKGLVALWRESLLAKKVLENKTIGYKNHPQLNRFKKLKDPVNAINQYLDTVLKEAQSRGYNFDATKISQTLKKNQINVTSGQIEFEAEHLLKKLETRDKKLFGQYRELKNFDHHPIFNLVKGKVEEWEII